LIDIDNLRNVEGVGESTLRRIKDYIRGDIKENPPFIIEPNNVYSGNAEEVLTRCEPGLVDLTVTSPPYDSLRTYNDYTFSFEDMATQLYRVTAEGGVVVWVVGDAVEYGSETGTSFRQAIYFKEIGFRLHDTMIYEKTSFAHPSSTRYHQIFEYMLVLSKGEPKTFNPIFDKEVKWPEGCWGKNTYRLKDGTLAEREKRQNKREFGMRTNIWRMNCGKGFIAEDEMAHEHPAIFPEELARDHIKSWSNPGDVVLDPMCGSGTVLKFALRLDRKYIGIDCSDEYCDLSCRRIENERRRSE
jgi:site-specific DNA-methyltransferase (adenine-specific)